ncbi:hypothetical protein WA026_000550 [Henosepilachna vigintioctopunctata]|uniref:tRNA (guanine-N(7)-)-methyltransferase non-catalytic subunit wuho n=1 Tax=Henosepilachna vigintioctopunctata TaxID=420089 RepID=A0AAW1V6G1_9CUCU
MVIMKYWGENILLCAKNKFIIHNKKLSILSVTPADSLKEYKNGNVNLLCIAISWDQELLAASFEDKQVMVFDKTMNVVKNFSVGRIPSKMCFSPSNSLIIADKTGDVFLYDLVHEKIIPTLLLGHNSIVLDVLITPCEKYIITCDRDEKIRVSLFPNAYNIQSFCLGHSEFVKTLKIVEKYLISAAGDGTIRIWNYLNGKQLLVINTNAYIDVGDVISFLKDINCEDTGISAVPITDMQVYSSSNTIFICISLFQYPKLLLFSVDLNLLSINFCKHIQTDIPFSFLLDNELFVLTTSKISCYILKHQNYVESRTISVSENYNISLECDQSINQLYKKKFDNVAEYFKAKRARQELK